MKKIFIGKLIFLAMSICYVLFFVTLLAYAFYEEYYIDKTPIITECIISGHTKCGYDYPECSFDKTDKCNHTIFSDCLTNVSHKCIETS